MQGHMIREGTLTTWHQPDTWKKAQPPDLSLSAFLCIIVLELDHMQCAESARASFTLLMLTCLSVPTDDGVPLPPSLIH
jgi:hypothetical protein